MNETYGAYIAAFGDDDELHTVDLVRRNADGSESVVLRGFINSRLGGAVAISPPMAIVGHEFYLRGIEGIPEESIRFEVKEIDNWQPLTKEE